jgi:acyl-CoA thioester hydrolase
MNLDGAIRDGRHSMPVRVYYEDTDFTGIVYHANYLRYMERGRTNYLRLIGADHRALFEATEKEAPGFAFVVRSMTIDWLKPARMDDVLDVVTSPAEVKGASITLLQQCRRGEELLCEAHVRVAFISQGRARPIPERRLRVARVEDELHPDIDHGLQRDQDDERHNRAEERQEAAEQDCDVHHDDARIETAEHGAREAARCGGHG